KTKTLLKKDKFSLQGGLLASGGPPGSAAAAAAAGLGQRLDPYPQLNGCWPNGSAYAAAAAGLQQEPLAHAYSQHAALSAAHGAAQLQGLHRYDMSGLQYLPGGQGYLNGAAAAGYSVSYAPQPSRALSPPPSHATSSFGSVGKSEAATPSPPAVAAPGGGGGGGGGGGSGGSGRAACPGDLREMISMYLPMGSSEAGVSEVAQSRLHHHLSQHYQNAGPNGTIPLTHM
uniref:SRY-box transcription factor 3 n=1 Tax=Petromyzon marinus TaxID=7757 RepID=S4RGG7_PETMA